MRGAPVTLNGAEKVLRYDLNAIAEIGDRLGISLRLDRFREDLLGVPLPLSALRTIIWAGLIHAEPALTEHEVGGWVDHENLGEVIQAFFSLFGGHVSAADQQKVASQFGVTMTEAA